MVLRRRRDLPRDARVVAVLFTRTSGLRRADPPRRVVTLWRPAYGLAGAPEGPDRRRRARHRDRRSGRRSRGSSRCPRRATSPAPTSRWCRPTPRSRPPSPGAPTSSSVANQRFEQALSRSNITVFTQDTDLRYTWIHNPRLGLSAEEMLGRTAAEVWPPDAADESLRAEAARARDRPDRERHRRGRRAGDEGRLYLDMTVSPTVDRQGKIDGMLCTAVDVTEKRLFEVRLAAMAAQLGAAYQRFELALENSADHRLRAGRRPALHLHPQPAARHQPDDFLGRTDAEIFPEPSPAQARAAPSSGCWPPATARERRDRGRDRRRAAASTTCGSRRSTDDGGTVDGVVGTALDLTERRRDEQRMRLMMRELTHRSKNLLAVIQAMARKTASLSDDIDGFIADFSARLRAMAAAHDLLVSQSWHGADLGDLIRASVAQTIAPDRRAGPHGRARPDARPRHRAEPRPRLPRARHQRQQVRRARRRHRRARRHLEPSRRRGADPLGGARRPAGRRRPSVTASAASSWSGWSARPSTAR